MEEAMDNPKVAFLTSEKKAKHEDRLLWYKYTFWKDDPGAKNITGRDFLGWPQPVFESVMLAAKAFKWEMKNGLSNYPVVEWLACLRSACEGLGSIPS
ncbi:unnamed protein product [Echinostoma caproni]|uniref:tRNA-synt_1g domain-containing protein n=1 Tax=Echinostoma caproni TaxID=27848 RepID=A0A183B7M4_9TREM|nr:unnamed protein product [Echinostoma caproni]